MSDLFFPSAGQTAYYARREAQERAAAARSRDTVARRVHQELAERYAALAVVIPLPA